MTSTIKVNNIQNQCCANIINESANTITIGASGETVTLASGASQTGFGRTGTVDWQTTVKTGNFTAASGEGYFINTTSGAITMTLPASPSAGDIVALKDYANTFDTNNLTIGRNSQPIGGQSSDGTLSTEGIAVTLVYADSTKGWQVTESGLQSDSGTPQFITATGGTITCCGNFKIHTFTGPGTFTVTKLGNAAGSTTVDYLVVAGGGSGGSNGGGGGGGGGYRESSGAASGCYSRSPLGACVSALGVAVQDYPITVGAGGTATAATPNSGGRGTSGGTSTFSTITSAGGGAGGAFLDGGPLQPGNAPGANGGSGGGGGAGSPGPSIPGGTGNTPPVSPPQGQSGGTGKHCGGNWVLGGGAGGATAAGGNHSAPKGGDGGAGATSSINGTPTARAGGAGGAGFNPRPGGTPGGGGAGISAGASPQPTTDGTAGTANTGGGGGAGTHSQNCGANGGSGVVIIRYKFQ